MSGPLIRVPRPQPRVVEMEDEGAFAVAMQQAEAIRRGPGARGGPQQHVRVLIQVKAEGGSWEDWDEFWSGPWAPTWERRMPQPSRGDLLDAARQAGARWARTVFRSVI